jgi:outer membrane protein OmpA-like peptidoglycan-associated protein
MPYAVLTAAMLLPLAHAVAQAPQPTQSAPSVASYLCTFAGKCDGDSAAPQATRDAPETKGFRLARPGGAAPAQAVAQNDTTSPANGSPAKTFGKTSRRGSVRARHAAEAVPGSALLAASTAAGSASLVGRRADLMVGFDLDSARLNTQGIASARIFAQSLQTPELSGKRFLIQGHTDLRGGRAHNMTLSERRAQAVADFLVSQGVERTRLETHGFGPDSPLPGHASSDPANRRVEAELLS